MLKEKTGIGTGLLFVLLFSSILSYGLIQSPMLAAEYIGFNGYLGIILSFVPALMVILAANNLNKRFPEQSLIEYMPKIFGNFLGRIISFIHLIFLLFLAVIVVKAVADISEIYFISRTPFTIIISVVLFTSLYVASRGIEGITRLAGFVFPLGILFMLLSVTLSLQKFDPDLVRPVFFTEGFELPLGMVHSFNIFLPLAMIFTLHKYHTERQKGGKVVLGAMTLAGIILFLFVFGSLGVFGAGGILRYSWPIMELTRQTNIPFAFQTIGIFFSITWITLLLITAGGFIYAAADGCTDLFKVLNYKWYIFILFPIEFMLVLSLDGTPVLHQMYRYFRVIGFIFLLSMPLVSWLVAWLRGSGELSDVT